MDSTTNGHTTPDADATITEALRDPKLMVKHLQAATEEDATTALRHYAALIRAEVMEDATTGFQSLASAPEIQADFRLVRQASILLDTISTAATLSRAEALALLAVVIKNTRLAVGHDVSKEILRHYRAMLEPTGDERAALGTIADALLVALYDRDADPAPSRDKVLRALKAARMVQLTPAAPLGWWAKLRAGLGV